ncbi:MAG: hypothetical protein KGN77_03265 [Xanthomonadaceae bacterium]|nr:hypothetical protein [Xanthomonadaceae bacterium]MDE1965547.1 hypothetical protein [Xanthomonadaceae bacterium]
MRTTIITLAFAAADAERPPGTARVRVPAVGSIARDGLDATFDALTMVVTTFAGDGDARRHLIDRPHRSRALAGTGSAARMRRTMDDAGADGIRPAVTGC